MYEVRLTLHRVTKSYRVYNTSLSTLHLWRRSKGSRAPEQSAPLPLRARGLRAGVAEELLEGRLVALLQLLLLLEVLVLDVLQQGPPPQDPRDALSVID